MMISGFTARQLDPYTWAIKDHGHDTLYLLAGDEYALLAHLEYIIPASISSPSRPPRRPQHMTPVGEGDLFDLGGCVIEGIDFPGPTCLMYRPDRIESIPTGVSNTGAIL
jgi:hypothetical protein